MFIDEKNIIIALEGSGAIKIKIIFIFIDLESRKCINGDFDYSHFININF